MLLKSGGTGEHVFWWRFESIVSLIIQVCISFFSSIACLFPKSLRTTNRKSAIQPKTEFGLQKKGPVVELVFSRKEFEQIKQVTGFQMDTKTFDVLPLITAMDSERRVVLLFQRGELRLLINQDALIDRSQGQLASTFTDLLLSGKQGLLEKRRSEKTSIGKLKRRCPHTGADRVTR